MPTFSISFPIDKEQKLVDVSSHEHYYLLEYNAPPDNRYTIPFLDAYLDAITYVRGQEEPKPLITTSKVQKFFSNGLDFENAIRTEGFFPNYYFRIMRAIIEFPWPTIAVINGHAFAAGFMLSAAMDYRVMNPEKGFLCLNELQFGAPFLAPMLSIFKLKFGAQQTLKIALTAHRFPGKEALASGLVDALGGMPEGEALAKKVFDFAKSPSYGTIRLQLLREVVRDTYNYEGDVQESAEIQDKATDWYEERAKKFSKL